MSYALYQESSSGFTMATDKPKINQAHSEYMQKAIRNLVSANNGYRYLHYIINLFKNLQVSPPECIALVF